MFDKDGKLDIFEGFRIDHELPKFNRSKSPYSSEDSDDTVSKSDSLLTTSSAIMGALTRNRTFSFNQGPTVMVMPSVGPKTWFERVMGAFTRAPKDPPPSISVEEFFKSVKNSAEELKVISERAAGYESAIVRAKQGGQRALLEQLAHALVAVRAETQLLAMGLPKFLEEATVVEFAKKASKGLRLDWVANYTSVIPEPLLNLKVTADARFLFDNYVVLHFDPGAKSWAETHEEKERRKDPILFGVMQGRRRLYYIGDWVNEFCDLTMDQIADTMGKDVVHEIPQQFVLEAGAR